MESVGFHRRHVPRSVVGDNSTVLFSRPTLCGTEESKNGAQPRLITPREDT